jgi:signal transduction histidine kinase
VRNAQTNLIQGLGLGLSFVAWIVKAHGGQIEVTSTVGEGTRFTVRLPAEAPAGVALHEEHAVTPLPQGTT